MNLTSLTTIFAVILAIVLNCTGTFASEEVKKKEKAKSPHVADADCSICHVAPKEKLQSWFVLGSTKRELTDNPTSLCQKCHGVSFGHGAGKKTPLNREDLPLNPDQTINCALTCHNMHVSGSKDFVQNRYHLRLPINSLCESCHDK